MTRYLFDIETDGLLDTVTTVHSLVLKDIDTGTRWSFADQDNYARIEVGLEMLRKADFIVGHNIMTFDLPALEKVRGFTYTGKLMDTLVVSRLIWSDRSADDFVLAKQNKLKHFPAALVGKHSLEAWGYRLGLHKGDFGKTTDWTTWTTEMQDYCELDVEVTGELFRLIESQNYSERAIKLEHDFQEIMFKQEQFGFRFNVEKSDELAEVLRARKSVLESELRAIFPDTVEVTKTPEYWEASAPGYRLRAHTRSACETQIKENYNLPVSRFTFTKGPMRKKVTPFNPGSRTEIAARLMAKGWVPEDFTDTGLPQIDEDSLAKIAFPEAKAMSEYFVVDKRLGQVAEGKKAWLKLQKEGRIHGRVITNGAVTGRCTHSNPNVSQTPAIKVPYGLECRSLWEADPGYVLVGADASGIELRNLGHYMFPWDGGDYGREVASGDVHTRNQTVAELATRDDAKTFIYALCYGAGDEKLGSIPGVKPEEYAALKKSKDYKAVKRKVSRYKEKLSEHQIMLMTKGHGLRRRFMEGLPAYQSLIEAVKHRAATQGYLRGLDGRRLPVRSAHSALNTLLQSAGALIVKLGTVLLYEACLERGWKWGEDFANVAHIHDEVQIQARPEIAEELGKLAVESFAEAGRQFDFSVPITGTYSIGPNWAQTH